MKTRTILLFLSVTLACVTVGGAWLSGAGNPARQIGPNTASPAYIVVGTSTPVTFTSVIADSTLWRHDPLKVLLVQTDASGKPIDILGRMIDNGRKADSKRNDRTYTIQVTLNESAVGPIYFKIAALFREPLFRGKDDEDWDRVLSALNDPKAKLYRRDRLPPLLRKLERYTVSDVVVIDVWQVTSPAQTPGFVVALPPDWTVSSTTSATNSILLAFSLPTTPKGDQGGDVTVFIWDNPQRIPLREYFDGDPGPNILADTTGGVEAVTVDAKPAIWYRDVIGQDTVDVLIIDDGSRYLEFDVTRDAKSLFQAALATLHIAP